MKSRITLLTLSLFSILFSYSQKKGHYIYFKTGTVVTSYNLSSSGIDSINRKIARLDRAFLIIQFDEIPSELTKKQLASQGIELLNYIPDNAYTATVKGGIKPGALQQAKARFIYQPLPQQKMDASLANGLPPSTSVKVPGTVDVWVSFPRTYTSEEVMSLIKQMNVDIISSALVSYHVLSLRIAINRIFQLAEQPFVEYVLPAPPPDQPLNKNSRSLSHANVLNASIANGGKGLNGEGVVIGIGDNADIQSHIDFTGRLINRTIAPLDFHGMLTDGIAAGGGIVNELYRGYMPKATIISQYFNGIFANASTYVADYNMVVTNNSYGDALGCENNGIYDFSSNVLDQQSFDMPYLQHVFAAGNSGASTCAPYPLGFRTVLGGYQTAKNILCVGSTDSLGLIGGGSKGPVLDGRLKPDITAQGRNVVSAWPGNTYAESSGTSLAAPAVAGGAGLLYQQYRQLHANADPKSGLIKALLCNGATDKGNAGPDFKYGFGCMNLLRSTDMLENSHYFTGSISNGNILSHLISIPANTSKLKIMLYWNDPASSVLAAKALVNDLDLEVTNPSSTTILPLVLDSTFAHVNDEAVNGRDHTNNIEQVVIDNPLPGSYTIKVKGTAINQNPSQEYFVVYDAIPNSVQLTYPVGGEGLVPGEFVNIAWDAYGDETTNFTLQYSIDAGASWNDIATNVVAGSQFFSWQVPGVVTDKALVRVIKNSTGQISTSHAFTIIGLPTISLSPVQCEGYFAIEWPSVSGATDYEVMKLKGDEMVTAAIVNSTSYVFSGLSKDSTYWVSVRARVNGKWGRRSIAISRQPNNGTCTGSISDNDLKLNALLSPVTGRKFTSTELSSVTIVKAEIRNLDDAPVNNFTIKYSIDGGASWVTENVSGTIAAGAVYTHTFATPANFSSVGSYTILVAVTNNSPDANTANDTLKTTISQLPNQPLNLSGTFIDNIETASEADYENKVIGIAGDSRYDFENTTPIGRLRTFINSGIAFSGKKAFSMDVKSQSTVSNTTYLTGTYNLSNYNTATNELRLDFQFNMHGKSQSGNSNKVWIRGDDTKPWLIVYDLNDNNATPGNYKLSTSIEVADSLAKYGQNFSSSFQVRWEGSSFFPAVTRQYAGGTSIDDVRLYEAFNDAQIVSIDSPFYFSCGLNTNVPIKITLHNGNKNTLTNLSVKYSVNGEPWVTETIPSLTGDAFYLYRFNKTADLSQPGKYVIKAVVDYPGDNFHDNDTVTAIIRNIPSINSFPYLEKFEADDGGWYAEGINSSWGYGTPSSLKINHAASGAKAWKTNLSGNYNNEESSYLYSPCFQIGGLSNPTLSFSAALDIENCGATKCDALAIQYSTDGKVWYPLGDAFNSAVNWYNSPDKTYWSIENYTRWHVVSVGLPKAFASIRFRFAFNSDQLTNKEGVAIDDVHVYDNTKGIYDGTTTSIITQIISGGNNWFDFEKDGKLVASVNPNNQNLGTTSVQAYINTGEVRNTGTQYYHNRNITIKPAKSTLTDSATVRFYFLDNETEALINAVGCNDCTKPSEAYELGVSQYDDYDTSFENGSLNDNQQGLWNFINSTKTAKVPFDKGYYAEFKVKDFSEFWLNTGAPNRSTPLPVKLFNFSVQKTVGENVLISWTVGSESNVVRYEIEVARTTTDLQTNNFQKIGEVVSKGNSASQQQYSFVDTETFKAGSRYYRIKTINSDGSFSYSVIRSVIFDAITNMQVLPNPSTGLFYLLYQLNMGETLNAQITDAIGKVVKLYKIASNGSTQKTPIDISGKQFAPGIYMLQVQINGKNQTFKLYKQ